MHALSQVPCVVLSNQASLAPVQNNSSINPSIVQIDVEEEKENGAIQKTKSVFQHRYAQKQKSVSEKLTHQLHCAIVDGSHKIKCEPQPFVFSDLSQQGEPINHPFFASAIAQHIGSRSYQEDGFLENSQVQFTWKGKGINASLFAVVDGHLDQGNVTCHLNAEMIPSLEKIFTEAQIEYAELEDEVVLNVFTQVFDDLAKSYQKSGKPGGAVVSCLFRLKNHVYVPNVGDSRTILIKRKHTYPLTEDAVLSNPRFAKWHLKKGHKMKEDEDGVVRIPTNENRGPMFAREIGSLTWMCNRPKITKVTIGDGVDRLIKGEVYCQKGDFFLIASDGFFEAFTSYEAAAAVRKLHQLGYSLQEIAEKLVNAAGSCQGNDNVTVQLIAL